MVPAADVPLVITPRGPLFHAVSSLAASPAGDRFFMTWATIDPNGPDRGSAAVVKRSSNAPVATKPFSVAPRTQAVFDGTDFAAASIVADGGFPYTNAPAHLVVQRFDVDGHPTTAVLQVAAMPYEDATSVVSTRRGIAVGWPSGAALVAEDGSLSATATFPPSPDPNSGLLTETPLGLTVVQDRLIAAHGSVLSTLDWLGAAPANVELPFLVAETNTCCGIKGGGLCFFASNDTLTLWGTSSDGANPIGVFTGALAGPFTQIEALDYKTTLTQAPDGCGGLLTLSVAGQMLSVSGGWPSRTVTLGTLLAGPLFTAAMTTFASGFAVAWIATDGLHLATLDWG